MNHRKIRMPNSVIKKLRDLSCSYPSRRPIPELIRACLRHRCGNFLFLAPTTREDSEALDIWLDDENATLDNKEIIARTAHALIGIEAKLIPANIQMHKTGRP